MHGDRTRRGRRGNELLALALMASVATCAGGDPSQRREVGQGRIGAMGVFVYMEPIRCCFVVTLVLSRGLLPEGAPLLQAEDFDLELTDKEGRGLRLLRRPEGGPMVEFGGPGFSANAVFEFARDAALGDLREARIRYRGEGLVLPIAVSP
jgi:hypothetical protein